ncbi:TRAP transporter large permease [Rubrimonas cliftonensis]|uniref:TRAP transporter large permease protein n=1 Tax=Rubrimonas cliftonensis TaxID=89524 RepID=A0A1H4AAL6_9RHOB|nr:TRAP transporter large permease [Rubrimonas cliftonensis]SEA33029.1 TRAP transporter, DctM subunit [Rubrimonas cliftonensis]
MIGATDALIGFALMLGMMFLGVPVAAALFLVAALGAAVWLGMPMLMAFGGNSWSVLNDFTLTSIPLFILLGEILLRSGMADRMYESLSDWVSRWPGGLLHTNVLASGVFAAVSGSSVATAATIGSVALPAMASRGYAPRMALGSIAAGATLGILIPPSINMIIYGAMTNTSIGRLFLAGVAPGLLMMALFLGWIALASRLNPEICGVPAPTRPLGERLRRLSGLAPPIVIFAVVMGGIYAGWATPTEAAALGVLAAVALAALARRLSVTMLHQAFEATVRLSAMILLILVAAQFLNFVIGVMGVPQAMTRLVAAMAGSPLEALLLLTLFYLVIGCFLETLSMMVATIPVVFPIVVHFGIDPVWFGVFLVILMEVALITPPIGMNLYVVQGVRGEGPISDVIRGAAPFVLVMLAMVALLIALPQLALWLPDRVFG